MRIVIDLQGAQSSGSRNRGIGRYSTSLTEGIIRNRGNHDVLVVLSAAFPDSISEIRSRFDGLIPQSNILTFDVSGPTDQLTSDNDERRRYNERLREAFISSLQPDVVHVTSLFEGLNDSSVVSIGKHFCDLPTSVTLYDLIPLINSDIYLENDTVRRWYHDRLDNLRRADQLLSISGSSRDEAIGHLGFHADQVTNVGTAADPQFVRRRPSNSEKLELLGRHGIRSDFVMYTGGIDIRKNIERLIQSFAGIPAHVRAGHTLAIVCACGEADRERLLKLARSYGLNGEDVVLTGFVSEDDLISLYSICKLFVFPSWHEGFGLPALEAMHCGAPVVGSNRSSLPEVIGWQEAMFDPLDCDEMSAVLTKGLSNKHFRQRLQENGARQSAVFSWDRAAITSIASLENLAKSAARSVGMPLKKQSRPRLAYISPIPPDKSGIATYSSELIPELCRHYEIDWIVADGFQTSGLHDTLVRAVNFLEIGDFVSCHKDYDRILYHIGNSEYHMHMLQMLEEIPGVVVQHDLFLSGLLSYMENHYGIRHVWSDALYRTHGYKALVERFAPDGFMNALWKYPSSRLVFDNSIGMIMHSQSTINQARDWLPQAFAEGIEVIPHMRGIPGHNDRNAAREKLGLQPHDFIVCSFGIMGETKLSHRLLDGWLASNLAKAAGSRLIFVGQADAGDYGRQIADRIAESGCSDRISITGWADDELYKLYLQASDLAVQLRTRSRGETSGTILDCMAYGTPTIVNAHGSAADLAPDSVVILPDVFTDADLIQALDEMISNPEMRNSIGERARSIIMRRHSPRECASSYAAAIESFYDKARSSVVGIANDFGQLGVSKLGSSELTALAEALSKTMPAPDEDIEYFDLSSFAAKALPRHLADELKHRVSNGSTRIEPVIWSEDRGRFVFARRLTLETLGLVPDLIADGEPVTFIRNASCIVVVKNESDELVARGRWSAPSSQLNISCTFERLGVREQVAA